MEITDGGKEKSLEIEIKERSSWRYLFGRWVFKISTLIILFTYPTLSVIHLFEIPNIFDMDNNYWEFGEHNLTINTVKYFLILFLSSVVTIRFWILRGRNSIFTTINERGPLIYPDRFNDESKRTISLNLSFYLFIFQSLGIFFNPVNWETSINPLTNNSSIFPYYVIHILFLLYFLISYLVVSNIKVKTDE
jgi:magnesium-transporting ATPase (P-type)